MNPTLQVILLFSMVGLPVLGFTIYIAYQGYLKRVAVKVVLMQSDRKIKVAKLKVNEGIVTHNGQSYVLDKNLFMIGKGNWVTYYFKMEDAKPLNMLEFKSSGLGSSELNAQINGHLMKELLGAFEKKVDPTTLTVVLGVVMVAGFGAIFYFMMEHYNSLLAALEEIRQILRLLGGV
jgi:hypothetical protein